MKIHDEIEDWMAGALCEALTPDEQQNFERHLADCPHCRSLYEENQKMNDILKQTLPELRPDQNFERRVIAGFREKIAGGGFHPWRGLVWFVQFRTVQTALAILALAAMVKGGSLITGERFPGGSDSNAQANTRILAGQALGKVTGEMRQASTSGSGAFISSPSGTRQYRDATMMGNAMIHESPENSGNLAFNGPTSDTRTISGTVSNSTSANTLSGTLANGGNMGGYTAQVFSGQASWAINGNWGDTSGADLGGAGAPGVSGPLAVGDTATFRDVSGAHGITGSGNVIFGATGGANTNTVLGSNSTIGSLAFQKVGKDSSADANGISVTGGNSNLAFNNSTIDVNGNSVTFGGALPVTKVGAGTLTLTGTNSYSGQTTVNAGAS